MGVHGSPPNTPLRAVAPNCNELQCAHNNTGASKPSCGKTQWEKPSHVRKATVTGSFGLFARK